MGYMIEDNCVGCPQGCVGCGRDHEEVHYCDKCKTYSDGWNPLYVGENGEELCRDCYKEQFNEKMCDNTLCSACGKETDFLYQKDEEWYCEECLFRMAERVET